jgi:hypothetical protein
MGFRQWYNDLLKEDEDIKEEDLCIDEPEEDDESDDEWAGFSDCDVENDELTERLVRKTVFRNGKRVIKFVTDKENHRVQMKNGRPMEVRMKPEEVMRRKRSQKLASRKRKSSQTRSTAKRNRTLTRRKTANV